MYVHIAIIQQCMCVYVCSFRSKIISFLQYLNQPFKNHWLDSWNIILRNPSSTSQNDFAEPMF